MGDITRDFPLRTDESRWHHIAGTLSGVTKQLWLDGVEVFARSYLGEVRVNQSLVNLWVGKNWDGMLDGGWGERGEKRGERDMHGISTGEFPVCVAASQLS